MAGVCKARFARNLPVELTSFVDRRGEAAAVKRLLRRHRMVTLTGGPGVGKTRLALWVAKQMPDVFLDGVWLVELGALDDARFLGQAVADAVGMPGESEPAMWDGLTLFLADKDLLLVLDGCEHLVDACARLVTGLLSAAPGLRVLVTSRQALGIAGEWLMEVAPLPVPSEGRRSSPARNDAVRLFNQRAAIARPGFTLTKANGAAVAEVCRRLEGIPLAIELAAVRVRAMPVEGILARLTEHPLKTLGAGAQAAMPRLQTMWAAIDWSFRLCSPPEQRLWMRASVFSGGFELDDAEHVCSGAGIDAAQVVELVAGLVDKSVLTCSMIEGLARYRMLEPIREYGTEHLARSGEITLVRMCHRDHFAELARRAEQQFLTPEELEGFDRLAREHANARAALEICMTEPGQARAGLEMAGNLQTYFTMSAHHHEGRYWLDRALSLNPEPSPARTKALQADAWLALLLAEWQTARSLIDESLALAERLEDVSAQTRGSLFRGILALGCGDVHRAVALLEDVLPRLWALDDRVGAWNTLRYLMDGTALLGDAGRCRVFGEQCLEMADRAGASVTRAHALGLHGVTQWLTGDHERGTRLIRERLAATVPPIDRWGIAHCLEVLAWNAAAENNPERAARLLGCAHAIWRFTAEPPTKRHLTVHHGICNRQTRAALGEQTFGKLFDEGTRFPIDQAIAYALTHESRTPDVHEEPKS
ncbi:LuxR family transcriptional regulator [Actinoallomurus purpureus]|uniref:ATP-binding protein n=1 Tax=Actinoallomurus purpureus TaxID=478114 RepID=UPI0020935EAF|nr:LuxR family transcriptional regulator [Actinoallomurus purpureus]MCO6006951.1 LuxR family transcriptional regulator [Actinoallomurus purpureus]